ncbi:Hypothetical protein CINCED_3A022855 [Cinara cedri]|uniref:Uncharacterized protein n=1 Tax=Cinara cedri TaxID=506608 RepID=A0A5E4N6N1_9HEMI|nr:Hypothetical protein CINCED_3A022855 [Cinara cedri]
MHFLLFTSHKALYNKLISKRSLYIIYRSKQLLERGLHLANIVKYVVLILKKKDYYENHGGSYLPKLKSDAVPSKLLTYPSSNRYESKVKVSKSEFHINTSMVHNVVVPLLSYNRDLFSIKTDNNTQFESNVLVEIPITEQVTSLKKNPVSPIFITPSKNIRTKVVVTSSSRLKSPSKISIEKKI